MKFNKKLKKMSVAELNKALLELKQELFHDNSHISQDGKPKKKTDTGKMRHKKRNVARILMEIRLREMPEHG